jgi:hypothetical protein
MASQLSALQRCGCALCRHQVTRTKWRRAGNVRCLRSCPDLLESRIRRARPPVVVACCLFAVAQAGWKVSNWPGQRVQRVSLWRSNRSVWRTCSARPRQCQAHFDGHIARMTVERCRPRHCGQRGVVGFRSRNAMGCFVGASIAFEESVGGRSIKQVRRIAPRRQVITMASADRPYRGLSKQCVAHCRGWRRGRPAQSRRAVPAGAVVMMCHNCLVTSAFGSRPSTIRRTH